ncbi:MAG TPA: YIP1 family protein, partial [Rubrobacteraceae bacterium]|nr:YIP1 family protein [Rubrobacteraceae bacterium]
MDGAKSPEFDPERPVASSAVMLRAIFLKPRTFYLNFDAGGSVREPVVFVLLVSAASGFLSVVANLVSAAIFGSDANLLGVAALNLVFVVLSPILVGAAAGVYLLSVRAFAGPEGNFREVYRMLAYAYGA